jgi:hypothetical protein
MPTAQKYHPERSGRTGNSRPGNLSAVIGFPFYLIDLTHQIFVQLKREDLAPDIVQEDPLESGSKRLAPISKSGYNAESTVTTRRSAG